jgi:uroporphyrinogen decarboxylase
MKLKRVRVPNVDETLGYVFDTIKMIKQELNGWGALSARST